MTETTTQRNRQPAPRSRSGFTHESQNTETVEWYTPRWLIDAIGIHYDIDVCSPGADKTAIPADRHYTITDDGLTSPWDGTVWCNPPYGRETGTWMTKLADHGDGIALVFARTDTAWFQAAASRATAISFLAGRVKFIDGRTGKPSPGSPGSGSALLAYGQRAANALTTANLGITLTNIKERS
ncbi:phage N-6-adenine-methyltransferase [Curtobacterium sp. MCPF17_011]|uniref:phage N-6-adenine-methyltransferase n=1 Tax=Curtobacterium sp. MCPF17_011 TaxID=2175652 RepID=UPI001C652441|nr:phage N-6-adenine-methyltransferase [Curtobacterium sp. MCPF17_011]